MVNPSSPLCDRNMSRCLWCATKWAKSHEFTDFKARNDVLMQIAAMRLDAHPSGYPEPTEISMLNRRIRAEKFHIVRERGRGDAAAAEIQHLIDWLKRLEKAALQARPASVSRLPWYRVWSGLAGMILMLISPVFSALVVYLPPDFVSVLTLIVYALLTTAAGDLSRDKFAPQYATITLAVLFVTAVGMALHYAHTAVGSF